MAAQTINDTVITLPKPIASGFRDRMDLLPRHTGPHVLPNSPFFTRLMRHARRGRPAVQDLALDVTKTYSDVLRDALVLRARILQQLPEKIVQDLEEGKEVFIGVLALGGYEFTVAVVAVLALKAAVVPMTPQSPVEDLAYFVTKSEQPLLLCSAAEVELAHRLVNFLEKGHYQLACLEAIPHTHQSNIQFDQIVVSSDGYLNDSTAGVVIFTSGTTGKPKGAVLRRAYVHDTASAIADGNQLSPHDRLLHVLPVHHATGLGTSFFPYLNVGACIEFRTGSNFDASWIWDRFRAGGITSFSAVPTILLRLMWHYQNDIMKMPFSQRKEYENAVRSIRTITCGSSALQQPVQDFWTNLRCGQPILVRYGSSEIPAAIRVPADIDFSQVPKGSVGLANPGVDVKIADSGELLIKSPFMFSRYLHDEKATAASHDAQGYFLTGDIAHRDENGFYFIIGRASVDIIKSGGYKIGAPEIEKACLELPYIAEAMVVGVPDAEYGQRVAVTVTLNQRTDLTLDKLRADLRSKLPRYKLPTLLRVVPGELPKGGTGKVSKKVLAPLYFPEDGKWVRDANVQVWGSVKSKL